MDAVRHGLFCTLAWITLIESVSDYLPIWHDLLDADGSAIDLMFLPRTRVLDPSETKLLQRIFVSQVVTPHSQGEQAQTTTVLLRPSSRLIATQKSVLRSFLQVARRQKISAVTSHLTLASRPSPEQGKQKIAGKVIVREPGKFAMSDSKDHLLT